MVGLANLLKVFYMPPTMPLFFAIYAYAKTKKVGESLHVGKSFYTFVLKFNQSL